MFPVQVVRMHRTRIRILAVGATVAAFAAAGSTFAAPPAEPHCTAACSPCMDRSGGVTASMIECTGGEFVVHDRRLNAVYTQALAALPTPRRAALTRAQRAWLAFKKAECDFALDPDGGTAARVSANDSNLRMTAERADQLDAVLTAAKGL